MSRHCIIFWNIQRLFGSQGSPIEHALSGGAATSEDTSEKIRVISAVVDTISKKYGSPLLLGMAEIENVDLCSEIANRILTAKMQPAEIMKEDETGFALDGLNIGLLLNTDFVQEVSKLRSHVIDRKFITRDILECDFILAGGRKMSALINHWPSRMMSEAAGQRISAALYARDLINSKTRFTLQEMWDSSSKSISVPSPEAVLERALTPTVIMGDFNDEMFDESIELLGSTNDKKIVTGPVKVKGDTKKAQFQSYMKHQPSVYNPFWGVIGGVGSYYRTPRWRYYDQILMSSGLLDTSAPPFYHDGSEAVFTEGAIEMENGETYQITNRNGKPIPFDNDKKRGCSDHFPVVISIEL